MEDRTIKIEQAIINSSSVIPADMGRSRCREFLPERKSRCNIAYFLLLGLRLNLHRGLIRHQWNGPLLRIFGVLLRDSQIGRARRDALDHDAKQRAAPAHPLRIWLTCRGNDGLAFLWVEAPHNGDFLRATGEESAVLSFAHGMLDIFDADHRRIVLKQHGYRE